MSATTNYPAESGTEFEVCRVRVSVVRVRVSVCRVRVSVIRVGVIEG